VKALPALQIIIIMASQRTRINKRGVEEGHGTQAPISSSISKRLRGAMSVSSVASSVNSGTTTEADTEPDYYGSPNPPDSVESFPDGAILVNGVLQGPPKTWSDFDDHPEEEDYVQIHEDDYEDEEPGDENAPPPPQRMPLSERSISPAPPSPPQPPPRPLPRPPPSNRGSRAGKTPREAPLASARALAATRRRPSGLAAEAIASSSFAVNMIQVCDI
jgi:hypothetical protein